MADVRPRGLFPEITAVLQSLTASEQLLLSRLRDLRLEQLSIAALTRAHQSPTVPVANIVKRRPDARPEQSS
jgi:hypothetical protein